MRAPRRIAAPCDLPCPPAPQGVADAECRRAAAAAEEAYRREFDAEGVPPEPDALLAEHRVRGAQRGQLARWGGGGHSAAARPSPMPAGLGLEAAAAACSSTQCPASTAQTRPF